MAPAQPPPQTSRWRLLALILAALPTMLIAAWAAWVLTGFLAMRDQLGPWQATVHDATGTVVGQGHLDVEAHRWVWYFSPRPPWLVSMPVLPSGDCGTLTLMEPAMAKFGATRAATCPLHSAYFVLFHGGRGAFVASVRVPGLAGFCDVVWPQLLTSGPGTFDAPRAPGRGPETLTVDLTR